MILYERYNAIIIFIIRGIILNKSKSINKEIIISIKENKSLPILKNINPFTNAILKPVKIYP